MSSILLSCPSCEAKNRIPGDHVTDVGRCGHCKNLLPPSSQPIEADPALFDAVIANAKLPVLVDFWASWCGPCKMVAPEVHKLAQEVTGQAVVLKVDTEAYPQLAARFGVQSIPNFVIFRDGKQVFQRAGAAPRTEMRRWLEHFTPAERSF